MATRLYVHGCDNGFTQWGIIRWVGPDHTAKVNRMFLAQAEQQPALSCQPYAIAIIAEIMAVW